MCFLDTIYLILRKWLFRFCSVRLNDEDRETEIYPQKLICAPILPLLFYLEIWITFYPRFFLLRLASALRCIAIYVISWCGTSVLIKKGFRDLVWRRVEPLAIVLSSHWVRIRRVKLGFWEMKGNWMRLDYPVSQAAILDRDRYADAWRSRFKRGLLQSSS